MLTTVHTAEFEKQLTNFEVIQLSEGIYQLTQTGQSSVIIEV